VALGKPAGDGGFFFFVIPDDRESDQSGIQTCGARAVGPRAMAAKLQSTAIFSNVLLVLW
jgi:hypothetical protein